MMRNAVRSLHDATGKVTWHRMSHSMCQPAQAPSSGRSRTPKRYRAGYLVPARSPLPTETAYWQEEADAARVPAHQEAPWRPYARAAFTTGSTCPRRSSLSGVCPSNRLFGFSMKASRVHASRPTVRRPQFGADGPVRGHHAGAPLAAVFQLPSHSSCGCRTETLHCSKNVKTVVIQS